MKSTGSPQQLGWPLTSLVVKYAGFVCKTGHWKLQLLRLWLLLVALLSFLAPSHVYTSQLCWSGLGETKAGPWCSAKKG